jgi:hypothetical protein
VADTPVDATPFQWVPVIFLIVACWRIGFSLWVPVSMMVVSSRAGTA